MRISLCVSVPLMKIYMYMTLFNIINMAAAGDTASLPHEAILQDIPVRHLSGKFPPTLSLTCLWISDAEFTYGGTSTA